jgi:hypothetical protein
MCQAILSGLVRWTDNDYYGFRCSEHTMWLDGANGKAKDSYDSPWRHRGQREFATPLGYQV